MSEERVGSMLSGDVRANVPRSVDGDGTGGILRLGGDGDAR